MLESTLKSTVKAAAALAFAVGIACGAHAARTVCVSEQTDSAVTLAFGGVDELDYELFLAPTAATTRRSGTPSRRSPTSPATRLRSRMKSRPRCATDGRCASS